jgi:hypothetical protein
MDACDRSLAAAGVLCLLLAATASPAQAQGTKCQLGIEQSPLARGGFKLGMSERQAVSAFGQPPQIVSRFEDRDSVWLEFKPEQAPDKLANLWGVKLSLFEDRVYEIEYGYKSGNFDHVLQIQDMFAREWKLPAAWAPNRYSDAAFMTCKGWELKLLLQGRNPRVVLTVPGVERQVIDRQKNKGRAGFRP